jgi:hypothetical protein
LYAFVFFSCFPHASSISFHMIRLQIFVESSKTFVFIMQCVHQLPLISSSLGSNTFLCTILPAFSDCAVFLIPQTKFHTHIKYTIITDLYILILSTQTLASSASGFNVYTFFPSSIERYQEFYHY